MIPQSEKAVTLVSSAASRQTAWDRNIADLTPAFNSIAARLDNVQLGQFGVIFGTILFLAVGSVLYFSRSRKQDVYIIYVGGGNTIELHSDAPIVLSTALPQAIDSTAALDVFKSGGELALTQESMGALDIGAVVKALSLQPAISRQVVASSSTLFTQEDQEDPPKYFVPMYHP